MYLKYIPVAHPRDALAKHPMAVSLLFALECHLSWNIHFLNALTLPVYSGFTYFAINAEPG